jgi:hypothetical protein
MTPGEDSNSIGVPDTNAKACAGKTVQATEGAPLANRHERQ